MIRSSFAFSIWNIRSKGECFFVVLFSLMNSISMGQNINVVSTNPRPNAINVSAGSSIQITFDQDIEATTLGSSTVIIQGNYNGLYAGSYTGGGTTTITFTPDEDFYANELICVTITTGLTSTAGFPLTGGRTFYFKIATVPGPTSPVQYYEENALTSALLEPFDVSAGDIDGDGDLDLLGAWGGSNTLAWYENDGNENFIERIISTNVLFVVGVFMADVNGDGHMDVLSASAGDNKVSWFENDGSQNFTERIVSTNASRASNVFVVDMDGDGDLDIISGGFVPVSSPTPRFAWHENDGNENFTEWIINGFNLNPQDFYAIDVDDDGDMDLVVASQVQSFGAGEDKLVWLENDGSQNFTERILDDVQRIYNGVQATDLDQDGDVDIVYAAALSRMAWLENDGNENFTAHELGVVNQPKLAIPTDIDGDGDLDVLFQDELDDKVAWFENDGDQNFTERIASTNADLSWSVYPADIDSDGDLDIVGASRFDDKIAWYNNTTILGDECQAPPTADAGQDTTILIGEEVRLNGSIGGGATSAVWSTEGDGSFDDPTVLMAVYTPGIQDENEGVVVLTLTTDDPDGAGNCIAASSAVNITLIQGELVIYNGVSPRVNGKNDYFRIENIELYPERTVEIFNRWGQKVYMISGYNNNNPGLRFEGRSNINGSDDLVEGTYYYVITIPLQKYTGYLYLRR